MPAFDSLLSGNRMHMEIRRRESKKIIQVKIDSPNQKANTAIHPLQTKHEHSKELERAESDAKTAILNFTGFGF